MAQIAHIRGGSLIRRFTLDSNGKARGRVNNAAGAVICMPPVAGFSSADDKVVPVETETVDNSTTGLTQSAIEVIVETTRVLDRTVISDMAVTTEMVAAERERRLALGFDYDFGDARGVHHIGTTDKDMVGWDEVTQMSQAAIAIGAPSTQINILTETGPATITALEWQSILLAAASVRQPLWAASFALQAIDPIPADYATNETYWQ